jgi:hypothetical protein
MTANSFCYFFFGGISLQFSLSSSSAAELFFYSIENLNYEWPKVSCGQKTKIKETLKIFVWLQACMANGQDQQRSSNTK